MAPNWQRAADAAIDGRMKKLGRASALELGRRLMQKTPVDTGRARANWNGSMKDPDYTTTESTSVAGAQARLATGVRGFDLFRGETFYMSNGLPYIERLDEGYSKQAPAGMVDLTLAEMKPFIERLGGRLKRG